MDQDPNITRASELIEGHQTAQAAQLLINIIQKNPLGPEAIPAWLLMTRVVDSTDKQIDCVERVLKIDPINWEALELLRQLKGESPVVPESTPELKPEAEPSDNPDQSAPQNPFTSWDDQTMVDMSSFPTVPLKRKFPPPVGSDSDKKVSDSVPAPGNEGFPTTAGIDQDQATPLNDLHQNQDVISSIQPPPMGDEGQTPPVIDADQFAAWREEFPASPEGQTSGKEATPTAAEMDSRLAESMREATSGNEEAPTPDVLDSRLSFGDEKAQAPAVFTSGQPPTVNERAGPSAVFDMSQPLSASGATPPPVGGAAQQPPPVIGEAPPPAVLEMPPAVTAALGQIKTPEGYFEDIIPLTEKFQGTAGPDFLKLRGVIKERVSAGYILQSEEYTPMKMFGKPEVVWGFAKPKAIFKDYCHDYPYVCTRYNSQESYLEFNLENIIGEHLASVHRSLEERKANLELLSILTPDRSKMIFQAVIRDWDAAHQVIDLYWGKQAKMIGEIVRDRQTPSETVNTAAGLPLLHLIDRTGKDPKRAIYSIRKGSSLLRYQIQAYDFSSRELLLRVGNPVRLQEEEEAIILMTGLLAVDYMI